MFVLFYLTALALSRRASSRTQPRLPQGVWALSHKYLTKLICSAFSRKSWRFIKIPCSRRCAARHARAPVATGAIQTAHRGAERVPLLHPAQASGSLSTRPLQMSRMCSGSMFAIFLMSRTAVPVQV